MSSKRGFGSRFGYIMTLAGFCIGISNMWKFPYIVGENGGGAFLIIYIICAITIGIPLFMLEQQLGRSSQLSGVAGMEALAAKHKKFWGACGWMGLITVLLIAFYFWTILGWNVGYLGMVIGGKLYGMDNDAVVQTFTEFSGSWPCVLCSAACALLVWLMLNTDIKKGVEKLCSVALPLLIFMLAGLAIYSATLPGAIEGLKWYLIPHLDNFDFMAAFQAAVVQVFFSVGIGMACAFVYGSYIRKDSNLCSDACIAVGLDTLVATLSGLVVVPVLFAFGVDPASGPSLIFISLPQVFTAMGNIAGRIFGAVFLTAVFLACITSMVAVVEAVVANMNDKFRWSRKMTNTLTVVLTFGVSVIVTINQGSGALNNIKLFGQDLFSLFDTIASAFGLTLTTLFELAFVIFCMGFTKFREEVNLGAGKIRVWSWLKWHYNFVLPAVLCFVIICIFKVYGII